MGKWDSFNTKINKDQLAAQMKEAKANEGKYEEVPAGTYTGEIEKMEIGSTKDGRPMFKVQFRITEGNHKKQCLFMNRVIAGTKNDGNMIQSVIGWLNKLETETVPEFNDYDDFDDLVADIMEEIDGAIVLTVDYDPDSFNSLSIKEIFDK